MNSEEYLQIINRITKLEDEGIAFVCENANDIDYVRRLHLKLQAKLEYLLIDPFSYEKKEEREDINEIAKEIKQICTDSGITFICAKMPSDFFVFTKTHKQDKNFASYFWKDQNITDLIVFKKQKKEKSVNFSKKKEILKNSHFEEDSFDFYNGEKK